MLTPTLLDGRECSKRLGMTYQNLMFLRRSGVVEGIKLADGRYLFNLDRVARSIRAHNRDEAQDARTS
jgi:hypothetical protein